jgi:hypothetical protein
MFAAFAQGGLDPNAMMQLGELRRLNQALRDAARGTGPFYKGAVGYPQQGVAYTGEIAPLVPQSIQATLDSATFLQEHIKFWREVAKTNVTSTLHEETRINQHGSMDLDPFIAEGEIGPLSEAEYERQVLQIKYLAEHIEVSDPATMVGALGVNRSVLAQRTQNGTLALMGKLERALFNADSLLSPLHFDGLDKQVSGGATVGTTLMHPYGLIIEGAATNYTDLRGLAATPQKLQEILGELVDDPNYAMPNVVYVPPKVYQALVNIATAHGRHDQLRAPADGGPSLTWGHKRLFIGGMAGQVEIKPCPLLMPKLTHNTTSVGSNAPATPVLVSATPAANAYSKFTAADVAGGDFDYQIVAVGDRGVSAPLNVTGVTVAAGDRVPIIIDDDAIPAPATDAVPGLRYYRVFRAPAGTTAGWQWAFNFPRATPGGDTTIYDYNAFLPGTGRIYVGQNTQNVLEWSQLLDFTRRPLAQAKTTVPFLLMLFGSLWCKVPTKWWALHNASFTL